VGQEASFTVDAFADSRFKGTVSQIRLSPQIVQNVVTYPVMLDVPNPELKLKPGMTANVLVPVDERREVLRIPNAALRFRPDPADVLGGGKEEKKGAAGAGKEAASKDPAAKDPAAKDPAAKDAGEKGAATPGGPGQGGGRREGAGMAGGGPGGPGGPRRPGVGPGGKERPGRTSQVYVVAAGGKLKAVPVKTSITDGNVTAGEAPDLKPGDEVVIGTATARASVPGGGAPGGGGPRGMRM